MVTVLLLLQLFVFPTSYRSEIEKGDQQFARVSYAEAEGTYAGALLPGKDSAEVLWRLARLYLCMADVALQDQKLGLYRQAESFAARCISADSMKPEGHTWRAAALGNIAMFVGNKTKVKLCPIIKMELDQSLRLNPSDDIAYSVLGSFYMALGNVSWIERQLASVFLGSLPDGGYDEAEYALKRAIIISPGIIRHHAELGDLYMLEDRTQEAMGQFQLVLSLPVRLASDVRAQADAARMIRELTQE